MKKAKKPKSEKSEKSEKTEISEEELAYNEWIQLFACDDPYWKFPTRYVDFPRLMGHAKKFENLGNHYPDCVEDLLSGVPTYYCVLCVSKSDPRDVVRKAYQRKRGFSGYPDHVLERACEMLGDRKKRSDYEEILRLFLKVMQGYSAKDKREIVEEHDEWLEEEKHCATGLYIVKARGAWINLSHLGAPTFYELLGVDRKELKAGDEVRCNKEGLDRRLSEEVCRILNNPQLRFEYDFMFSIADKIQSVDYLMDIERRKPVWKGNDLAYLAALRYYDVVLRYQQIMSAHIEWAKYTDDKTFYDVLTIDRGSIPEDKREAERFIRNVYRNMERTPEVNLAYSVLKNFRMRGDYDWLLERGGRVNELCGINMGKVDDATLNKMIALADAVRTC